MSTTSDSRRQDTRRTGDGDGIRREMQASTRALSVAHDNHVDEAMGSVRWERRGVLQRLTRRAA